MASNIFSFFYYVIFFYIHYIYMFGLLFRRNSKTISKTSLYVMLVFYSLPAM